MADKQQLTLRMIHFHYSAIFVPSTSQIKKASTSALLSVKFRIKEKDIMNIQSCNKIMQLYYLPQLC